MTLSKIIGFHLSYRKTEFINLRLEEYLVFFLTQCALWKTFKTAHLDEIA